MIEYLGFWSIRRKTYDSNSMTERVMGEIHLDFVCHHGHLIGFHQFTSWNVFNINDTRCYLEMVAQTTIASRGVKSVAVDGTESCQSG